LKALHYPMSITEVAHSTTRQTLSGIVIFIERHPLWWRNQVARAATLFEDESLEQWLHYAKTVHNEEAAQHALSGFVRLVDEQVIQWLSERDEKSLEGDLLFAARMLTSTVKAPAPFRPAIR
jgi:hypothetical protein